MSDLFIHNQRDLFHENKYRFMFLVHIVYFAPTDDFLGQNIANCKNRYCFYNKNILVLTELFFDILSYKP